VPRYLIEVPHSSDTVECARVAHVFLSTGSHFLTHAHWGCADGVHSAWLVVEDVPDKQAAAMIIPPAFRAQAKITRLVYFRIEKIEETLRRHGALPEKTSGGA
jgi:hypothetical protein